MDDGTGSIVRKTLDGYRALYAKEAGIADSAAIWSSSSVFKIQDNDGTNTEANGVSVNGSAATYTLKLPATIKASITGNLTGTADKAKQLVNGSGTAYSIGSSTKPVYFSDGVPVAVDSVDATATAADKWSSPKTFRIEDSATTPHQGADVSVDGSNATYVLKLPATIQASLSGTATNATKLVNSSNGTAYSVGDTTQPIYFNNGVPTVMGTTLGSSGTNGVSWTVYGTLMGTATKAESLVLTQKIGDTNQPVFFSAEGVPVAVTSLDASLISGTISADNLPASVKERMIVVADETAMKALSDTNAQEGDTVRLSGAGQDQSLYYIVSKSATSLPSDTITGTNFKFVPYSAGSAAHADNATTADTLSSAKSFSITGGVSTSNSVSFNGSGNVALSVTTLALGSFTSITGQLGYANGGTGFSSYTKGDMIYASANNTLSKLAIGTTGQIMTANNGIPAWTDTSDITDVGSAQKLSVAKTINGTGFNGTDNIVTASWGTARTITISDKDGTNTESTANVNGGSDFTLKLPATIKATLSGKANTAGTADKVANALTLSYTNVGGASSTAVTFDGSQSSAAFTVSADNLFYKFTATKTFSSAVTAGTWTAIGTPSGMSTGTYIVQIATNNATFNVELFSGVMSFSSETCENVSTATDSHEVILHACGKNAKTHNIFLRTRRVQNNKVVIEFSADVGFTTSDQLTFTFRRMI